MNFFDFFKIIYDEVFIVQLLAVSFSVVWVFYDWQKTKRSIAIGIGQIVGVFALGTLLNWLFFALSSVWHAVAGIHFHIAWFITIMLYLGIFDRTYVMSRIIMGATLFITVVTTADLGHELAGFMGGIFPGGYFDYICFITSALMVVFSFVIRKYTLKFYSDIPLISVILIMVNTLASIILIITKTEIKMSSGMIGFDGFYCMVLAVIYAISLTGYLMIYFHCNVRKEMTALEVQNKLLEADKQILIVSGQAIEEMRSLRHDLKNLIKVMGLMLEQGKYEELKEYFKSVSGKLNETFLSEVIDCGNQLINSVINMEILKATSYGVKLVSKISVPSQLPFESSDLCRVLVNLIDNAIEGVMRTDSKDYLIDVKIGKRADYLYIRVQNEIRDDTDRETLLKMNTVKDDAVNHGYGHKIVKKIVDKYNGCVNYTISENEFIAEVMLDLTAL